MPTENGTAGPTIAPPPEEVRLVRDDAVLAGSLWLPPGSTGIRAAVLMHPGSGPSDRHNDVYFPPIREHLLRRGWAVLAFDKRGVGGSTGSWAGADIAVQADDAIAGIALLADRLPEIPVGLFGHSQGGWVALRAARDPRVDFVITNSGPGVSPRVQERFSTANSLTSAGWTGDRLDAGLQCFDTLMDLAGGGVPLAEVRPRLLDAGLGGVLDDLDGLAFLPDSEEFWRMAGRMIDHDPAPDLRGLTARVLALFGAADTVVPVQHSVQVFRTSVPADRLSLAVLADGNHRISDDSGQLVDGYFAAVDSFLDSVSDSFSDTAG